MSRFKVAISHQADEAELAKAWEELLRKISGSAIECWFSTDKRPSGGMPIGKEWREMIYEEFNLSGYVLALQTHVSNGRPWVMWECGAASGLRKERGVIPIIFSMEPGDLNSPLSSYQSYRGENRDDVHRICDLLMREAQLVLDEGTFDAHYPGYLQKVQRYAPPPAARDLGKLGADVVRELVEGWLQTVCRAISAPQTPEQLRVSIFAFRKHNDLLVKQYLWCDRPRTEQTCPLQFSLDAETAERVVVVKCFRENVLMHHHLQATGGDVAPLPANFQGKQGDVAPDLGYVLAAPIRGKDGVWGVVDFDASSPEGAERLKASAAEDVLSCLAKTLGALVAT
jgi:TIR domain-containing protein